MTNSHSPQKNRSLTVICLALFLLASLPLLSSARSSSAATTVSIVNNSSREIRNVYTSHVDQDDWSGNQLGEATIAAGQSYDLSVSSCDGQQVKLIGEDQDGCFVSTVVSCGASSTWTITNDTTRDCGY
jgi:hypothetical protein